MVEILDCGGSAVHSWRVVLQWGWCRERYQNADGMVSKGCADQGCAKAQFKLGVQYLAAKGVKKSGEFSRKWIRKSAKQGGFISAADT
jgi:TPR repeat protein